ncbi:MAG: hypothetical protein EBU90_04315 [Proteobacteria bacterium]|nr:hypothetical protein [Pseudomonadota bacterium]NBP15786.1 hypothetical protein [bacterium]
MQVWVVYSKSKIHGVYNSKSTAEQVRDTEVRGTDKGGFTSGGVPKRWYYITEVTFNQLPQNCTVFVTEVKNNGPKKN